MIPSCAISFRSRYLNISGQNYRMADNNIHNFFLWYSQVTDKRLEKAHKLHVRLWRLLQHLLLLWKTFIDSIIVHQHAWWWERIAKSGERGHKTTDLEENCCRTSRRYWHTRQLRQTSAWSWQRGWGCHRLWSGHIWWQLAIRVCRPVPSLEPSCDRGNG